jgi:hypothetical protein
MVERGRGERIRADTPSPSLLIPVVNIPSYVSLVWKTARASFQARSTGYNGRPQAPRRRPIRPQGAGRRLRPDGERRSLATRERIVRPSQLPAAVTPYAEAKSSAIPGSSSCGTDSDIESSTTPTCIGRRPGQRRRDLVVSPCRRPRSQLSPPTLSAGSSYCGAPPYGPPRRFRTLSSDLWRWCPRRRPPP